MRAMNRAAIAGTVELALGGFGPAAVAQNAAPVELAAPPKGGAGVLQKRPHAPARIRVHPLAQSYPGPDAVRQCASWLAPDYRPSGTVIVPKMRCWWERG